jgi:hypothetical protein
VTIPEDRHSENIAVSVVVCSGSWLVAHVAPEAGDADQMSNQGRDDAVIQVDFGVASFDGDQVKPAGMYGRQHCPGIFL